MSQFSWRTPNLLLCHSMEHFKPSSSAIRANTNNLPDQINTSGCEDIAIACKYTDCQQGKYCSLSLRDQY